MLNVWVNTKPGVNALVVPESKLSPVPQAPAVGWLPEVAVCGVERMVHRTVSPTAAFVTAFTRMPPVPEVLQSTNPISVAPFPPQGGAISPISTSKVAARALEPVINANRLSIKNPMKRNFLLIAIYLHTSHYKIMKISRNCVENIVYVSQTTCR